ncbi:MAG: glycosyltransferase [Candidatus Babeliales bacterium]
MTLAPKILILSCHGGGGHMSAATALEQYLSEHYCVQTIDFVGTTLAPYDPLYIITRTYTGQDIYNALLQRNAKRITNFFYRLGLWLVNLKRKTLERAVTNHIAQYQPDMVISVIPIINDMIINSCKELGIKCVVVPTDFDTSTFISHLPPIQPHNTRICISMDYALITERIPDSICKDALTVTGFPIRPTFFMPRNKAMLKKQYGISHAVPVVLLVMGAAGSQHILRYLRELSTLSVACHLIICIGRATALKSKIHRLYMPYHITYTIIDHKHNIADYMALADLCITKPGSVTFAEIIYMKIPVLLDKTDVPLLWEKLNLELVQSFQIGECINHTRDIAPMVASYLTDQSKIIACRHALDQIKKEDFGRNIHLLVAAMLSSGPQTIPE